MPDDLAKPRGWDSPLWRQANTLSGLVLFTYVGSHLLNHAVGIFSVDALLASGKWFVIFWHQALATTALYSALTVHLLIALVAIIRRDSLRDMSRAEIAQLTLGLSIPVFLIAHLMGTRALDEFFGADPSYLYVQLVIWKFVPHYIATQTVLLLASWIHGCIGLHLWLRFKPRYRRLLPLWLTLAVMIPTLSLAGFVASGMEVLRMAEDSAWLGFVIESFELPRGEEQQTFLAWVEGIEYGYYGLILLVFAARSVRLHLLKKAEPDITLTYHTGQKVGLRAGATILETSRRAGIPHASVCGGRGRCSTCRVRIGIGLDSLPPRKSVV